MRLLLDDQRASKTRPAAADIAEDALALVN
jgi:hypothetical protein